MIVGLSVLRKKPELELAATAPEPESRWRWRCAKPNAVDLAALLSDAAELYDAVAEEKRLVIEIAIDARPQIQGDRDLLFQAIINLLDNTIKYSPDAGRILLQLGERDYHTVLTITDCGPGIPIEEHSKVLQRFYRMDKSRSQHGSGLGLSLVDAVARMHNTELVFDDNHPGLIAELHFHIEHTLNKSPRY